MENRPRKGTCYPQQQQPKKSTPERGCQGRGSFFPEGRLFWIVLEGKHSSSGCSLAKGIVLRSRVLASLRFRDGPPLKMLQLPSARSTNAYLLFPSRHNPPGPSGTLVLVHHPGGTCRGAGEGKGLRKTPLLISNSSFQV